MEFSGNVTDDRNIYLYAGVLEQTCSNRDPCGLGVPGERTLLAGVKGQVFVRGVESLPFGDALVCAGGNLQSPTEYHFTGKERDTESGNDYFGARYYASSMGRFISSDWNASPTSVP